MAFYIKSKSVYYRFVTLWQNGITALDKAIFSFVQRYIERENRASLSYKALYNKTLHFYYIFVQAIDIYCIMW